MRGVGLKKEIRAYVKVDGTVVDHARFAETMLGSPKDKARAPLFIVIPIRRQPISLSDSPAAADSSHGIP